MKIFILPQFIEDLKSLDNIKTLGKVLEKLFDGKFEFKQNRDDHRYLGVKDAWIRDISKGSTAYRGIYIQKDDKIYLYRAGTKKIEENLSTPDLTQRSIELTEFKIDIANYIKETHDYGKLLRSPEPTELFNEIMRFNHVPLKEIFIVSPIISKDLFNDTSHFGKFINKALEEKASVFLITKPPQSQTELRVFNDLEIRGVYVSYNEKIHAKLWYFEIDFDNISRYSIEEGYANSAILGSSNMTAEGIGISSTSSENNIELCYRLPYEKNVEFYKYCGVIFDKGIEHSKYKSTKRWP